MCGIAGRFDFDASRRSDPEVLKAMTDALSHRGPDAAGYFIDGGIMSNFPINLFHTPDRVPAAPTFGAKIGIDRSKPLAIATPAQLVGAIFDAARHTLDYDFIIRHPDYHHLVKMIDTGSHNWLDFAMAEEAKVDLFATGAEAAADFLCGFDWPAYKKLREDLAAAVRKSRAMD